MMLLAPEPINDPTASWLGPDLRRTGFVYDRADTQGFTKRLTARC
jgi:hypothetical protein